MSAYDFTLLIHIILFCYWLGGDIGVFYSSKFVVDPSLQRETRLIATKIMMGCDLIPKICMTLMLTVGGILSELHGIAHPTWQMVGIVLLGPFWLTVVLILHFKHDAKFIPALTKFDFYFRCLIVVGLIVSTSYSWLTGRLADDPWMAGKLLMFAFLVFCGLMIRVGLKDFGASYGKIIQDTVTDEDNQKMIASLDRVRPWVYAIWVGLVIEATLGIVQPGSPEQAAVLSSPAALVAQSLS
ncbi:MAG: hypothetical protein ACJAYG_000510 [Oceanicoccus sp.]|jgi:hypothetical protein